MPQWEYSKIDLNNVPVKSSELDTLDDAGKDGWELVGITANNCAYLKRPIEDPRHRRRRAPRRRHGARRQRPEASAQAECPAQACRSLASSARSVGARSLRARP